MSPFTWTPRFDGPISIIKISGDFHSGDYFEAEKKSLSILAKKNIESNLVIFDLSEVIYWDTEPMNFLNDLLKEINSKHLRAAICCPKTTYAPGRFLEKFGKQRFHEIWFETKDDFLKTLKKPTA